MDTYQTPLDAMGISLVDGGLMIVAGRSNSGKSHFIRYLFSELRDDLDYGLVFSNTSFEGTYDYVPSRYIYEEYSEEPILALIKIQKQMIIRAEAKMAKQVKKGKIPKRADGTLGPNPYKKKAFILLDDCCADREFDSPVLKKLAVCGRHYNIFTILSTQYVHLCPPVIRANCNYSLFFDVGLGKRELEATYDWIGGRFRSFSEFKQYYYANTQEHRFVLFHRDHQEYRVFRAPADIPKFQLQFRKQI